MGRMLEALKNLEAKEVRQPANRAAAAPAPSAIAAKSTVAASTTAVSSKAAPVAPRIIEVVDKLDAVVGRELGDSSAPMPATAFASSPAFAFGDFSYFGQPKASAPLVPPLTAAKPEIQQATRAILPVPATKAPGDLERQVRRTLNDRIRSQPLIDLVDRLLRDMEQTESKVLAFVSLGSGGKSPPPVLHAATLMAERRSKRVLLIDGDAERRNLSEGLEYGRCAGLSELLAGKIEITTSFQPLAAKELSFLPFGQAPRPAGSRAADALEAAIREWKIDFDCLLIDAGNADGDLASALAEAADATYLVVELGAVEANAAQVALARLRAAGARVLGCIAT